MRIEQWSATSRDDDKFIVPPELQNVHIQGCVYDHSDYTDGTPIVTSKVVQKIDSEIITNSGSRYILGEPSVEYVEWCTENGYFI